MYGTVLDVRNGSHGGNGGCGKCDGWKCVAYLDATRIFVYGTMGVQEKNKTVIVVRFNNPLYYERPMTTTYTRLEPRTTEFKSTLTTKLILY